MGQMRQRKIAHLKHNFKAFFLYNIGSWLICNLYELSIVFQIIENNLQETQYSRWMAACRMAAKGKTMADRGYDAEVKSIQVNLQKKFC